VSWVPPRRIQPLTLLTLMYRRLPPEKISEIGRLVREYLEMASSRSAARRIEEELMRYLPVGMLFMDEITKAPKYIMEKFIQALTGESKWASAATLSPLVRLVFAANPPSYDIAANILPEPVLRRVVVLEVAPEPEEVWNYVVSKLREYYPEHAIPFELYGFFKVRPEYFIPPSDLTARAREEFKAYPCPATLMQAAQILAEYRLGNYPADVAVKLLEGTIGPEATRELIQYLALQVPEPEKVLAQPEKFEDILKQKAAEAHRTLGLPIDLAERYLYYKILTSIASYIVNKLLTAPEPLIEKLVEQLTKFIKTLIATRPELPLTLSVLTARIAEATRDQRVIDLFERYIRPIFTSIMVEMIKEAARRGQSLQFTQELLRGFLSLPGR